MNPSDGCGPQLAHQFTGHMPGQPNTRAAVARLESYGLERILDRIIDGDLMADIARDVNVSRPMLSRWLNGHVGNEPNATAEDREKRKAIRAERQQLYLQARALSGQNIVEDGMRDLDSETDPKAAHLARGKAEFRLKLAGYYDRTRFGDRPQQVNVNINQTLGDQHLDALRRRKVAAKIAEPALPSGEPDVEVADG